MSFIEYILEDDRRKRKLTKAQIDTLILHIFKVLRLVHHDATKSHIKDIRDIWSLTMTRHNPKNRLRLDYNNLFHMNLEKAQSYIVRVEDLYPNIPRVREVEECLTEYNIVKEEILTWLTGELPHYTVTKAYLNGFVIYP